ncbi:DUF2274 domain-containing protein [Bradyrhizobium sp. Tv2a-2]|uniref:DUF2274 domain-containing protein n=1 Tax=Bradyrhizobium sp. Tv2a-2 TaxID=113395 RepID=UPI00055B650C|nr:DUF2274 domain-containing protein [Bradyrhizobium sp. Tv2a-2]
MAALKITKLHDDKPVRVTVELPAAVHRDLVAYAEILSRQSGETVSDPKNLVAPMLARFMATDRAFAKSRRRRHEGCG